MKGEKETFENFNCKKLFVNNYFIYFFFDTVVYAVKKSHTQSFTSAEGHGSILPRSLLYKWIK